MRRALATMSGSRPLLFAFDLDATLWVRLRLALRWLARLAHREIAFRGRLRAGQ